MIPSVSNANTCSNKKKTRKVNTKKNNKASELKNQANTVSQQVNPLSITTDNTLVNHTTRTVTDGVFTLQHKTKEGTDRLSSSY